MDIDKIASLNKDNVEELGLLIQFAEDKKEFREKPETVKIRCVICREMVGFIRTAEVELPLRGDMIHPTVGCENWPLPGPWDNAKDFVCPHAWDGDKHCFLNVVHDDPEATNSFLTEDYDVYVVGDEDCPCGCGGGVKKGNKYANGLECYRRHQARG